MIKINCYQSNKMHFKSSRDIDLSICDNLLSILIQSTKTESKSMFEIHIGCYGERLFTSP